MSIYELTSGFGVEVWRKFVREKLELDDDIIGKTEEKWQNQFEEQRFQMFKIWQKKKPDHEKLLFVRLKHEFFCGFHWSAARQPTAPSDDVADGAQLSKAPKGTDELVYHQSGQGGCALIICNSFKGSTSYREGAAKYDNNRMKSLWGDTLKCKLVQDKVHEDASAEKIKNLCKEFVKHSSYDYFVLVISTHGGAVPKSWLERCGPDSAEGLLDLAADEKNKLGQEGNEPFQEVLIGNDWRVLSVADLKDCFGNVRAGCLANKPKLLIFQHCRGSLTAGGVFPELERAEGDADPLQEKKTPRKYFFEDMLPVMSDVAAGYATQESYEAYTSKNGSAFVRFVSEVFAENWRNQHVVDMLTMVNSKMKKDRPRVTEEDVFVKPMSVFESCLEKKFYLALPKN